LLKIDAGSIQTQDSLKLNLSPSHLPATAHDLGDVLQQAFFCCSPCGPGSFTQFLLRTQTKKMEAVLNLETLKVPQLKALLKEKGLPVSGRKDELIKRLRSPPVGPKPKAWQHSEAKKILRKALLDPKSIIHKMSIEEVKNSDPSFKQYPNFEKYYKDLTEKLEEQRVQAREDDLAAAMHLLSFPKGNLSKKGYPHWDGKPAQALLQMDVMKGRHRTQTPSKFYQSRVEYTKFPAAVFRKRVHREDSKQKSAAFWWDKRNKIGMKRYLSDIEERAAEASA
jgi:hypothetical protein